MAPEAEINQVFAKMLIESKFKERVLDPKTRTAALREAIKAKWASIPLTEADIEALSTIKETNLPGFAQACIDRRLVKVTGT